MEQNIALRPLGKLMNLIESSGYQLEYQYEDLVFVNHTAFLFRFDEHDSNLVLVHFNEDCDQESKANLSEKLVSLAATEDVKLSISTDYQLKSEEGKEEVQIIFKEESDV